MATVIGKTKAEFDEAEMERRAGKKPKKMPHEMNKSQLTKHHERAREISSNLSKQLIDAGLGNMRHSELMESEENHPLIKTYKEHSPYLESLEQEVKNREEQKYGLRKDLKV